MRRGHATRHRHGVKRLRALWAEATPEDVDAGMNWYPNMNEWCIRLSVIHGVSVEQVAALAAIYSPRKQWDVARAMTERMLDGDPPPTFGRDMAKAERIMAGEDPMMVVSGNKVTSFCHNLLLHLKWITIDTHAFEQVTGLDYNNNGNHHLLERVGIYKTYSACFTTVAREVGLEGASLQAVLWVSTRGRA